MNTYLILLLGTLLGPYFLMGSFIVSIIILAVIAYHWDKAAKANIEMWHELHKDDGLEDWEPFYF